MNDKHEKEGSGILHGLAELSHKLADAAFPEEEAVKTLEVKKQESPIATVVGMSAVSESGDPKICEALEQALKEKGGLYIQFMDIVESFGGVVPDEKQRYRAALVTMQRTLPGFSVDAISKALDERVQALNEERQKFLKSLDAQNARIAETEKALNSKIERIAALKREILEREEEKKGGDTVIAQEREKVAKIQQTFESALAEVQKNILESKRVIQKHLVEKE